MRRNVEVKEKTIREEIVTYVATDGTAFKSEEECRKYEETAKCAVNSVFKGVKQLLTSGEDFNESAVWAAGYESDIAVIYFETLADIEATNKFLKMNYKDSAPQFTSADLGTVQFIELCGCWCDEAYNMGSAEELKKRCCDYIDSLVMKAKGETEKKEAN